MKTQSYIRTLVVAAIFICVAASDSTAQVQARVRFSVSPPNEIVVQVVSSTPLRSWSFRNAYAGVLGIAERIEQFRTKNGDVRKVAVGEFRAEADAREISYVVRLTRPSPAGVAHATWLTEEHGFLMLADLLPQELQNVVAEFGLPPGWTVQSVIVPDASGQYSIAKPEDAVFFVGRSIRKAAKKDFESFIAGNWPFKDSIAVNAAARVMDKYVALTGYKLPSKAAVMIAPLPVATGSTKWRAETRGSTVLLLMDPQAQTANWKAQLEIIFAHEVLHLWVPNALRLQGDYDWFFEGFTLYMALLAALDLKAIDFREYVATLARVYDSYLSYPHDLSLIEASERRWTNPWPVVYDKGMLVAFLYDLMLRQESAGKTTLAERYRELFRRRTDRSTYHSADGADGNEVIIRLLSSSPAGGELVKKYIEGNQEFELQDALQELRTDKPGLLKSLGFRQE